MKLRFLLFLMMSSSIFTYRLPLYEKYPLTAEVVEINPINDTVKIRTATGIFYQFKGCEDYAVGDLISAIMDINHTPDYVLDDIILKVQYSGYKANDTY